MLVASGSADPRLGTTPHWSHRYPRRRAACWSRRSRRAGRDTSVERAAFDVTDALAGALDDARRVVEQRAVRQLHVHVGGVRDERHGQVTQPRPPGGPKPKASRRSGRSSCSVGVRHELADQGSEGEEDVTNIRGVSFEAARPDRSPQGQARLCVVHANQRDVAQLADHDLARERPRSRAGGGRPPCCRPHRRRPRAHAEMAGHLAARRCRRIRRARGARPTRAPDSVDRPARSTRSVRGARHRSRSPGQL